MQTNVNTPRRSFVIALVLVVLLLGALCISGVMAYRTWIAPNAADVADHVVDAVRTSPEVEQHARTAHDTIEDIREKKNRLKMFFAVIMKLFGSDTTSTP